MMEIEVINHQFIYSYQGGSVIGSISDDVPVACALDSRA